MGENKKSSEREQLSICLDKRLYECLYREADEKGIDIRSEIIFILSDYFYSQNTFQE